MEEVVDNAVALQPIEAVPVEGARLNITWNGQNGDYPDPVAEDLADADVRRIATEAIATGYIPGIDRADADLSGFVVDRFPATGDLPTRLIVRPKTPFGTTKETPTMKQLLRQGDVALVPVEDTEAPADAEHGEQIVLATGELTGHIHAFDRRATPGIDITRWSNPDGWVFAKVGSGGAKLLHGTPTTGYADGDHKALDVPAGTYRVILQREHRLGETRTVAD